MLYMSLGERYLKNNKMAPFVLSHRKLTKRQRSIKRIDRIWKRDKVAVSADPEAEEPHKIKKT